MDFTIFAISLSTMDNISRLTAKFTVFAIINYIKPDKFVKHKLTTITAQILFFCYGNWFFNFQCDLTLLCTNRDLGSGGDFTSQ